MCTKNDFLWRGKSLVARQEIIFRVNMPKAVLPDVSWYRKIYQMATKIQKIYQICHEKLNGHKISEHFALQALQNIPKLGFFRMKRYHLATLA
jgi:hypothetical protein